CPDCTHELALWHATAHLVALSTPTTEPPAHVLAAVFRQIDQDEARAESSARMAPHVGHLVRPVAPSAQAVWLIVQAQVRLTRASTWLASAFVMALGWLVAIGMPDAADAR